jgi:imidazole glycerol phosphate synthase glutamine amidotransferase subunit
VRAAICDYGAGNLRSVVAALQRLSVEARVVDDPEGVARADVAVLPGVGAARAAMVRLEASGVAEAVRARVAAGGATLGICLGLQLALERSDEDGGVDGLGLVPGRAVRLARGRVPRMGWAVVEPYGDAFYFAHSYVARTTAASATSEDLVAEARAGSFVGVQFHPEKSGAAGARYLRRVLGEV